MTIQIYVGNLPFSTVEDDVYELFAEFGDVFSINMIHDRETGRFRGFCYVEMGDTDAQAAIESLDGRDYNGRALRVNEVRPQGGSGRDSSGHQGGGGYAGNRGDNSGEDGDDWDEDGENWEEDEGDDDEEGEWADPDYPN